eukprot:786052-Rhodomonas_salina.1
MLLLGTGSADVAPDIGEQDGAGEGEEEEEEGGGGGEGGTPSSPGSKKAVVGGGEATRELWE